ncbi:MAG: trehalose-binding protein [Desulfobacteraceae bacterium]|nr:MAG: trehalose-binding protein [Desulfobacteraceae bacterium]
MPAPKEDPHPLRICNYTCREYLQLVRSFHGHVAPGMVLGGFMVDLACRHLPEGEFFDALCETRACLPDAIQILTPCTVGNGWLRIVDIGRFALSFYEKYSGRGIRVYVDPEKIKPFPEIRNWFFKLTPKKQQDRERLMAEIQEAGSAICSYAAVHFDPGFMRTPGRKGFSICPMCREAYPSENGPLCGGCQGELPYKRSETTFPKVTNGPELTVVPVDKAAGKRALHDMTQIVPGKSKGPAFKRNQLISSADICRLQKMGRNSIYVAEAKPDDMTWVHEDEAARALAGAMAGAGVVATDPPREGKVELIAGRDGLLRVDEKRLESLNMLGDVKCVTRHGFTVVSKGDKLAGTRAIPLYIHREVFDTAMAVLGGEPLLEVLPLHPARVGILVTGTEVFLGLVEDRFIPIIKEKVEAYGCKVVHTAIASDDRKAICDNIEDILTSDVDLLITTAGLSVDPDDVTRPALLEAGAVDLQYGAPILPGNMTLLARIDHVRVIGVPACALYHKRTSFDLLLPRLLARMEITSRDLAKMGYGGMCLECKACTFPDCTFGK